MAGSKKPTVQAVVPPKNNQPTTKTGKIGFKKSTRGWTTESQEEFLHSRIPQYKACQASKKFDQFWVDIEHDFENQWPITPPTAEELESEVTLQSKKKGRLTVSGLHFIKLKQRLTINYGLIEITFLV